MVIASWNLSRVKNGNYERRLGMHGSDSTATVCLQTTPPTPAYPFFISTFFSTLDDSRAAFLNTQRTRSKKWTCKLLKLD